MGIKQDVQITFGPVDQRKTDKQLIAGKLTEAENVYQDKDGAYVKRDGLLLYARDFTEGSFSTGRSVGAVGSNVVFNTASTVELREVASGKDKLLGKYIPTTASWQDAVVPATERDGNASHVIDSNGLVWVFARYYNTPFGGFCYGYRVFERDTGREILSHRPVTTTLGNQGGGKPVLIGSTIYFVMWHLLGSAPIITCAKFNVVTPTVAPTMSTIATIVGAARQVDVMPLTTGEIMVGLIKDTQVSFLLITAAGAFKAAPGIVNFSGTFTKFYAPASFAKNSNASGGTVYFHCLASNTAATDASIVELAVSPSTLVATSTLIAGPSTTYYQGSSAAGGVGFGTMVSYVQAAGGTRAGLLLLPNASFGPASRLEFFFTTPSTFPLSEGLWPVSEPFEVSIGGALHWFVFMQYETSDSYAANASESLEASWYLYNITADQIVSRIKWGTAGMVGGATAAGSGFIAPVTVSGTTASVSLVRHDDSPQGTVNSRWFGGVDIVTVDCNPVLGPPVSIDGDLVFPGAYPMRVDRDGQLMDLVPSLYPETLSLSSVAGGTLPAGTYTVSACYAIRLPGGRVMRSAPSPKTQIAVALGNGFRVTFPRLNILNGKNSPTNIYVEVYVAPVGQTTPCMLQASLANWTENVYPDFTTPLLIGESLYTDSGALDNEPPPSFKSGFVWARRMFVTGLPTGDTWYSNEVIPGRAVGFNGARNVQINGVCGGAIDGNYAAIIETDAIYAISGDGMDDLGIGGFRIDKLSTSMGTVLPFCCPSPVGLFFVGKDNGIWLITRDIQVLYVGRGIDNHKARSVVSMVDMAKAQQVRIQTADGYQFVFDYGRKPATPTDAIDTLGQWYVWTSAMLVASGRSPVGSVSVGDTQWILENTGHLASLEPSFGLYADLNEIGTYTPYFMKCTVPVSFAGITGFESVSRGVFLSTFHQAHYLKITCTRDGVSDIHGPVVVAAQQWVDFRPAPRKGANWTFTIEETTSTGSRAFTFEGLGFSVIAKPGLRRSATRI